MPREQDGRPEPARWGWSRRGHEDQLPSGTWAFRISLGGRRHLVTGETRTAARRARDALVARFRRGELAADPGVARQTLAAYHLSWLDGRRPQLESSSWARHRINAHTHLVPLLGRLRLEEVQPPAVRRRRVPVPAVVVSELVAQRERMREAKARAGPGGWPDPAGLVFPSRAGTPRHRTNVNRRLKGDARAAGLRDGLHPTCCATPSPRGSWPPAAPSRRWPACSATGRRRSP
jgi:hypothetical protein